MNIDYVVALLFFLDFFPNVGFGVAPTRPLVSESFQRPPRDTGEDVHVRVLEAEVRSLARPYTSNSSPSLPANLLSYLLNPSRRRRAAAPAGTKVN